MSEPKQDTTGAPYEIDGQEYYLFPISAEMMRDLQEASMSQTQTPEPAPIVHEFDADGRIIDKEAKAAREAKAREEQRASEAKVAADAKAKADAEATRARAAQAARDSAAKADEQRTRESVAKASAQEAARSNVQQGPLTPPKAGEA